MKHCILNFSRSADARAFLMKYTYKCSDVFSELDMNAIMSEDTWPKVMITKVDGRSITLSSPDKINVDWIAILNERHQWQITAV